MTVTFTTHHNVHVTVILALLDNNTAVNTRMENTRGKYQPNNELKNIVSSYHVLQLSNLLILYYFRSRRAVTLVAYCTWAHVMEIKARTIRL